MQGLSPEPRKLNAPPLDARLAQRVARCERLENSGTLPSGVVGRYAAAGDGAPERTAETLPMSLSPQQLQSLERHFAHHIGPLAHHLVKRAAAVTRDWEHLVGRVAAEIDSDPARARLISACPILSRPTP
jgi:hypothetical protein